MTLYYGISTTYRGVFYRSRLEARWVVFFDAMGWQHDYEPRRFSLRTPRPGWLEHTTWYTPDFYLLNLGLYVEVKPPAYARQGAQKLDVFTSQTGESALLLVDEPNYVPYPAALWVNGERHLLKLVLDGGDGFPKRATDERIEQLATIDRYVNAIAAVQIAAF